MTSREKVQVGWVIILLIIGATLACLMELAHAGDHHQDTQGHAVTYSITDSSGNPVSGQTPKVAVKETRTGLYLDHSDGTFKNPSSATTLYQTMTFDQTGGFYWRVVTVDTAALVSGDYVCIVSNDDATYGDTASESISFDRLEQVVKIHR